MNLEEAVTLLKAHQLAIAVKPLNVHTSQLVMRGVNDKTSYDALHEAFKTVATAHGCHSFEIAYEARDARLVIAGTRHMGYHVYSDPAVQAAFEQIMDTRAARGIVRGMVDFDALDFEQKHGQPDKHVDPIGPFAAALAKEGVNFPGSEQFIPKSPD